MPAKTYRFTVTGRIPFPCDMLRYDACYPVDSESASMISMSIRRCDNGELPYRVELVGNHPPTDGRWQSFSWRVENGPVRR